MDTIAIGRIPASRPAAAGSVVADFTVVLPAEALADLVDFACLPPPFFGGCFGCFAGGPLRAAALFLPAGAWPTDDNHGVNHPHFQRS